MFRISSQLRVRMIHLQAQTAALRRFHKVLSQDLKEPLISAAGFARLASQDLERGSLSQVRHDLEKINTTLVSASALTSSLILLGELDSPDEPKEELNHLRPLIREHFDRFQRKYSAPDAQLKLGEEWVRVGVSLSALDSVVSSILENSFRYRAGDRPLILEAGMASREDGHPQFFFRDNGRGLSPVELRRLNNNDAGTGTGLTLARRLAELSGGELRLGSGGDGKGTTVWVAFSLMELCERRS